MFKKVKFPIKILASDGLSCVPTIREPPFHMGIMNPLSNIFIVNIINCVGYLKFLGYTYVILLKVFFVI